MSGSSFSTIQICQERTSQFMYGLRVDLCIQSFFLAGGGGGGGGGGRGESKHRLHAPWYFRHTTGAVKFFICCCIDRLLPASSHSSLHQNTFSSFFHICQLIKIRKAKIVEEKIVYFRITDVTINDDRNFYQLMEAGILTRDL